MFQASGPELFSMPKNDLLATSVDAVKSELHSGIEQSGHQWELLVMDLSNVSLIDVRGIQLIEEAYKTTKDLEKKFMLINVSQKILSYLQLFRLHTKFPIGLNKTSAQLEAEKQSSGK